MPDKKSRGVSNTPIKVQDVPDAPVIGTATDVGTSRAYNNGAASVTFSQGTGGLPTSYSITSDPGNFTASGSTSPITVTGLQSGVAYSFKGTATNAVTTSGLSTSSNSITATTVPDAPTAVSGTNQGSGRAYNDGQASVSFSAPATGGKAISSYTVTSSPGGFTGTGASSPIVLTGLQSAVAYTYTVTATNANGIGVASSASGAVTATTVPQAPTIGTFTDGGTGTSGSLSFTLNSTGGSAITNIKYSTDGVNYTATGSTSSPITISGLSVGSYTFYVKAVNANGDSAASGSVAGTVIQPSNFEFIASPTSVSGTVITFSSIPQTYKHLQIRAVMKDQYTGNYNETDCYLKFNNVGGSSYAWHAFTGTGSAAAANGSTSSGYINIQNSITFGYISQANMTGVAIIDVNDYTSTTKNKTVTYISGAELSRTGGANDSRVTLGSGVFLSTAAVTDITMTSGGTGFSVASIALYGIK